MKPTLMDKMAGTAGLIEHRNAMAGAMEDKADMAHAKLVAEAKRRKKARMLAEKKKDQPMIAQN